MLVAMQACNLSLTERRSAATHFQGRSSAPLTPPDEALDLALVGGVEGSLQLRLHQARCMRVGCSRKTSPANNSLSPARTSLSGLTHAYMLRSWGMQTACACNRLRTFVSATVLRQARQACGCRCKASGSHHCLHTGSWHRQAAVSDLTCGTQRQWRSGWQLHAQGRRPGGLLSSPAGAQRSAAHVLSE